MFLKITQTREYSFSDIQKKRTFSIHNTNAFLDMREGIVSGKTGYTGDAGYCYVCAEERDGKTFIVALLGSGWPDHKTYKWKDVRKLVQYATDHYERREIIADTSKIKEISIKNGLKEKVLLKTGNLKAAFLVKKTDKIKIESILPSFIDAPVKEGQKVGEIKYFINGKSQKSVPIYAKQSVKQKDYWYYFEKIIQRFTLIA